MSEPLRVLLIGDTDSQLRYCRVLSAVPADMQVRTTLNVVPREGTPEDLLVQLAAVGTLWRFPLDRLLAQPAIAEFDAIGVFLTGSKIAAFRTQYKQVCRQKGFEPALLFCGFNGVVLENFEEGISWRLGYDLICLNGPRDQQRLRRFLRHTPFAQQPVVLTGLTRTASDTSRKDRASERVNRLVFAEQVLMPRRASERIQMVMMLAELARRSPTWRICIKPRVKPGERTFHAGQEHIAQTVERALGTMPANMEISYQPIAELLEDSRLMGTISSTAVFDALDLGCRPLVIADFGCQQDNGTAFFRASGLLQSLADCRNLEELANHARPPDRDWLTWVGYDARYNASNLYHEIRSLRSRGTSIPSLELPGHHLHQIACDGPNNHGAAVNQLRIDAEEAIRQRRWQEAEVMLRKAQRLRPENRNISRRLQAVRSRSLIMRSVRLALSQRYQPRAQE